MISVAAADDAVAVAIVVEEVEILVYFCLSVHRFSTASASERCH